jgi:hypothetical protein
MYSNGGKFGVPSMTATKPSRPMFKEVTGRLVYQEYIFSNLFVLLNAGLYKVVANSHQGLQIPMHILLLCHSKRHYNK